MPAWEIAVIVLVWTGLAFYAGMRYGNKLEQDALAELQKLRNAAAAKIKG